MGRKEEKRRQKQEYHQEFKTGQKADKPKKHKSAGRKVK